MPASMMIAPVGGSWKVSGNKMEIAPTGPIPGKTPINVPIKQPPKISARFGSSKATDKP